MQISLIVAQDLKRGIGYKNRLPWHLPVDLKFFKQKTRGHFLLMGRKTYESLDAPLPTRTHLVLTTQANYVAASKVHIFNDLGAALNFANESEAELFVIGGEQIFNLALPYANTIYLTQIHGHFECDTFFPPLDLGRWRLVEEQVHEADAKNLYRCSFQRWGRERGIKKNKI